MYLYLENIDLYRGNIIFFLVGHRTDSVGRYEALVSSEYVTLNVVILGFTERDDANDF